MKEIKDMTIEELQQLAQKIQNEIKLRKSTGEAYTFHFEFENDPRKGKPYDAVFADQG